MTQVLLKCSAVVRLVKYSGEALLPPPPSSLPPPPSPASALWVAQSSCFDCACLFLSLPVHPFLYLAVYLLYLGLDWHEGGATGVSHWLLTGCLSPFRRRMLVEMYSLFPLLS